MFSRRSLLALGAGLGASTMLAQRAGEGPKLGTQSPYWHRFNLGSAEVTVVSERTAAARPPRALHRCADDEVRKMLTDNSCRPTCGARAELPDREHRRQLILFDTGMGALHQFGPTTGRQQKSMAEAGIKPEDIDAIVFSHAHIDHIGGVVDANDKILFPNAQYYIAQSDFDFWTDEKKWTAAEDFRASRPQESVSDPRPAVFLQGRSGNPPGVQAWRPLDIPSATTCSW